MSAASASTGIVATPAAGTAVPSVAPAPSSSRPAAVRKRAPAAKPSPQQEDGDVPGGILPPSGRPVTRRRDVATTSANGDIVGSEIGALTQPRELSQTLLVDRPQGSKQKSIAVQSPPKATTPVKKIVKSGQNKEGHGVVRRRPSSFLDVTGHLFSRFFVIFVLGVGLGTSFYNWRVRPQVAETSGILSTEVEKLEEFVAKTTKWMQVQLEVVDLKIGQEVGDLRKEIRKELDMQQLHVESEVRNLRENLDKVSSALDVLFSTESPLTKREALELIKDVVDKRAAEGEGQALSLDDVRAAARQVVMREIERHSADGIGRVDYALASGGGRVVEHSEGYFQGRGGDWRNLLSILPGTNRRHGLSNKVLEPSFGEPGQCLPLKGDDVWVDISLRTAVQPDSITLEHVSKDVAYDVSSAPKEFRVFGWLEYRGQVDKTAQTRTQKLLGEFLYDITKPSVQTFALCEEDVGGDLINMIRVHVLSNHGSPTHTCIYRIRVHGSEPQSNLALSSD
ncbi:hypothetical protein Mapa_012992 [Marchantia paleacea]|nr:hypothetical protein Mapa_012992 [Marchantia paleacea]